MARVLDVFVKNEWVGWSDEHVHQFNQKAFNGPLESQRIETGQRDKPI